MMKDQLQRFLFSDHNVRGILVHLDDSLQTIMRQHAYCVPIQQYLGQLLAANSLLSANLKFNGTLTIQLNSQGSIEMLVSKCSNDLQIRGLAKYALDVADSALQTDFSNSDLVITISHAKQTQNYQSIVPIDGQDIAQCLTNYFVQSEQLATRLYLAANETQAAGLLLQQLPDQQDADFWQHLLCLSDTLNDQELLDLPPEKILYRLFHQETIETFQPQAVTFGCSCSVEKMQDAIRTLGQAAAEAELTNKQCLHVTCEFCNQSYNFTKNDVAQLFVLH